MKIAKKIIFSFCILWRCMSTMGSSVATYADAIEKAEAHFKAHPSSDTQKEWFGLAGKAYYDFPESPEIASLYAYVYFLQNFDPGQAIRIVLPYLHQVNKYPSVALALWRIFNNGVINAKANNNSILAQGRPWGMLLEGYKSPPEALEIMEAYWAKNIPTKLISPKRLIEDINKSKKDIDLYSAELIWRIIINNINNYEINQAKVKALMDMAGRITPKNSQHVLTSEADNQKRFDEDIKKLDVFGGLPNNLSKIEATLSQLTIHRRKFKEKYPNIPNFTELQEKLGSYEAKVINIAYKSYILRENKDALILIKNLPLKESQNDIRLLAIKIYCMQKEKFPTQQIIASIDHLLKLEPKNQRAFMLKKMLEAQEEYQQKLK